MCFSPQRRAIFRHLNFKKCSEPLSFLAFSLQNVLLATAACNFWFLLWPHDSAPAALTSLLFDSPDTRIIGKTQRFATPLTFGADVSSFFWLSRYCIFFLLTLLHLLTLLSSDFTSSICFSSAFQLSILSEVYYLNFLRLYISYIYIPILRFNIEIGVFFDNEILFEHGKFDMSLGANIYVICRGSTLLEYLTRLTAFYLWCDLRL